MLEAALRGLQIPPRVADVILPLAVAIFRFTSPVANLAVCFFVAHLYNIEPSLIQIVSAIVVAYAVSIAAVGLPGQVSFIASIAPICLALGVPIEPLALLMAKGSNCLVLDEPTNHLDMPAIEQLEQALETFPGTVLLVSHDRSLLTNVRRTRTLRMDAGRLVSSTPA